MSRNYTITITQIQLLHNVVGVNSQKPEVHAGAGGGLHHLSSGLAVKLQNIASGPSYVWPKESMLLW